MGGAGGGGVAWVPPPLGGAGGKSSGIYEMKNAFFISVSREIEKNNLMFADIKSHC